MLKNSLVLVSADDYEKLKRKTCNDGLEPGRAKISCSGLFKLGLVDLEEAGRTLLSHHNSGKPWHMLI